eukprot:TRINITY_DN11110_c0_g3_i2.p1 TRINITY_DN11110_c0_g3~~TRINITY_DN11110_c0_g3_i2.p1  ORF type:complete len:265 (-),score=39.94 TRINITY_DN11110_c0_g3_i2:235-1029(-)
MSLRLAFPLRRYELVWRGAWQVLSFSSRCSGSHLFSSIRCWQGGRQRARACWGVVKKVATVAFIAASIACMASPCAVVGGGAIGALAIASFGWAVIRTVVDAAIDYKSRTGTDQAYSVVAILVGGVGMAINVALGTAIDMSSFLGGVIEAEVELGSAISALGIDVGALTGREYDVGTTNGRLMRLKTLCDMFYEGQRASGKIKHLKYDKAMIAASSDAAAALAIKHKDIPGDKVHKTPGEAGDGAEDFIFCGDILTEFNVRGLR